jgi:sugar/nucleoside kinase (ribokinase family)
MMVSDPALTFIRGVRLEGPLDPTGAGDSVTAGCTLALAAGASFPEAALAGILVSSITVQQLATTGTATREQVRARLGLWIRQGASAQPGLLTTEGAKR